MGNDKFYGLSALEIYNMVLRGDIIKRFPRGFWQGEEGLENARKIIKYLIEERLKWNDDEVLKNLSARVFKDNALCGMLSNLFEDSPFKAYNLAYPGRHKPWEFRQVPPNYWSKENGIAAVKWLIEEKLKWDDRKITENLTENVFIENGLGGMLQHVFNYSPFEAINHAYPGKFRAWEFRQTPKEYWNKENSLASIKWLIEEKLKWNEETIISNLTANTFRENGLGSMLAYSFNNSPFEAITFAYPNRFKPWEFQKTPRNFWNKATAISATKWLVEEKLKFSKNDIGKITRADFEKHGLSGMLAVVFKGRYKEALQAAYPDATF